MGRMNVEASLAPISDGQPCGDNLEYDAEFTALSQAAQPVPEQVMGDTVVAAREPEWRDVAERALALLSRTKDLRVAAWLTRALLRLEGFTGLRDGLALVRALLDRHWEHVHPQLDPEDGNDPTYRLNSLAALSDPEGLLRDIRRAPIVASRSFGPVSYRDVAIATGELSVAGDSEEPRDLAQINAAFMESDGPALLATVDALSEAVGHVRAMDALVIERLGAANALDLAPLTSALVAIEKIVTEKVTQRGLRAPEHAASAGDMEAAGTGAPAGETPRLDVSGEVRSREDVVRLIDRICAYYERCEPSSPVPLLLNRAKRLVSKSFIDVLRDLAPDGVPQAELIRGADGESGSG